MNFLKQLLLIRSVRKIVGKLRFYYFVKVRRKITTLESKDAIDHTISHNLKALGLFGLTRMDKLIKPISVLENVSKDAKILVIGPRNEDDILNLIGSGFKSKNIIGLDLISYSPFIEVGDMHNMRFADSFFDVIICGWTLSYSNEPQKFAKELLRVVKSNGVIGIGVEYSVMTEAEMISHTGYNLNTNNFDRINSSDEILKLFLGHVKHIYFNHDAPNKISHSSTLLKEVSNVIATFSVSKN
jgi:SAM-dependent methyltransferase